jgi:putative tryptophan/tyrosine transport system substrate-binding protein
VRRRQFITLVGGAATVWPLAAPAQPSSPPTRIGFLPLGSPSSGSDLSLVEAFRKGVRDGGLLEGRDVILDVVWTLNGRQYSDEVIELIQRRAAILVTAGSSASSVAKQQTLTIPIVFINVGNPIGIGLVKSLPHPGIVFVIVADPIGTGLVEGLAHPGGNATGLSLMAVDLSGKHLALLKEAVPNLSRVALVVWPAYPFIERVIASYEKAARDLGISLWPVGISGPEDVEPVFEKMIRDRADGFALTLGPLLFNLRRKLGHLLWHIACQEYVSSEKKCHTDL